MQKFHSFHVLIHITVSLCLYHVCNFFFTILDFISLISIWFVLIFPLAPHSHFFIHSIQKEYFFQLSLKQDSCSSTFFLLFSYSSPCCFALSLPFYFKLCPELKCSFHCQCLVTHWSSSAFILPFFIITENHITRQWIVI